MRVKVGWHTFRAVRHHRLSRGRRRHARERASDGCARKPPNDQAQRWPGESGQWANLTASIIWNPLGFANRRVAARASRERPGERDDEVSAQGCNRVWDMSFGSDRRRLWVGNRGEGQIPSRARRKSVLRGEGRRVRRSRSRRRRYRGWRDGGSRATRALRNHQGQAPA